MRFARSTTWALVALLALSGACTVLADVDYRAPPDQPPDTFERGSDGQGGAAGAES